MGDLRAMAQILDRFEPIYGYKNGNHLKTGPVTEWLAIL
jgi:hypothetical protein